MLETRSPWQGSSSGVRGKIHILFCTAVMNSQFVPFSQLVIQCWEFPHTPGAGVQLPEAHWLKKGQNQFQRVRSPGVKFTCNFALNCQLVPLSSEISSWHRGSRW